MSYDANGKWIEDGKGFQNWSPEINSGMDAYTSALTKAAGGADVATWAAQNAPIAQDLYNQHVGSQVKMVLPKTYTDPKDYISDLSSGKFRPTGWLPGANKPQTTLEEALGNYNQMKAFDPYWSGDILQRQYHAREGGEFDPGRATVEGFNSITGQWAKDLENSGLEKALGTATALAPVAGLAYMAAPALSGAGAISGAEGATTGLGFTAGDFAADVARRAAINSALQLGTTGKIDVGKALGGSLVGAGVNAVTPSLNLGSTIDAGVKGAITGGITGGTRGAVMGGLSAAGSDYFKDTVKGITDPIKNTVNEGWDKVKGAIGLADSKIPTDMNTGAGYRSMSSSPAYTGPADASLIDHGDTPPLMLDQDGNIATGMAGSGSKPIMFNTDTPGIQQDQYNNLYEEGSDKIIGHIASDGSFEPNTQGAVGDALGQSVIPKPEGLYGKIVNVDQDGFGYDRYGNQFAPADINAVNTDEEGINRLGQAVNSDLVNSEMQPTGEIMGAPDRNNPDYVKTPINSESRFLDTAFDDGVQGDLANQLYYDSMGNPYSSKAAASYADTIANDLEQNAITDMGKDNKKETPSGALAAFGPDAHQNTWGPKRDYGFMSLEELIRRLIAQTSATQQGVR